MKTFSFMVVVLLFAPGCDRKTEPPAAPKSLAEARRGFATKLTRQTQTGEAAPEPPPKLFRLVRYPSPAGDMAAYVSPSPGDGAKHPAIIWIVGGFDNSIGEIAWMPQFDPKNDQSAGCFRQMGVIMMYPSLRGGNQNPGHLEGFYGEVDDVLAAAEFLAKQDYVDPQRIYLGGHSTGGTLALLVAESSDRFRAVFAFGPVGDILGYGRANLPFSISDQQEAELRSPAKWLGSVRNPTFVFEGTGRRSNIDELKSLQLASGNPLIHFHPVAGADHFSLLAPVSRLIAAKILSDRGPAPAIEFTDAELAGSAQK